MSRNPPGAARVTGSFLAVLGFLILATTSAAAAEEVGSFSIESSDPMQVAGDATVVMPDGAISSKATLFDGSQVILNATGRLIVNERYVMITGYDGTETRGNAEDPVRHTFDVVSTNLTFVTDRELWECNLVAEPGGVVRLAGRVGDAGVIEWFSTQEHVVLVNQSSTSRESVPMTFQRGWPMVGRDAFPRMQDPTLDVVGPIRFASGNAGNLTFTDESGELRTFRIGHWLAEPPAGQPPLPVTRYERLVRVYFEGTVAGAAISIPGNWSASAPAPTWEITGSVAWRNASGFVDSGAERAALHNQDLAVEGWTALRAHPSDSVTLTGPAIFAGTGQWTSVTVSGTPITVSPGLSPAATAAVAVTSGAAVLALVLGFGTKIAAALYTRLNPRAVLNHPTRQRIVELVMDAPGLHKRDLFRRTGGAWGSFNFHFGVLEGSGYLRTERHGNYLVVFPVTKGREDVPIPVIPNAVARAIYEALPADGSVLSFVEVAESTGVSRQLLNYHLRALTRQGFVEDVGGRGDRRVSRAAALAASAAQE